MGRIFMAGAEIDGAELVNIINPAGTNIARDTGTKRSGNASWKCDSTGSNVTSYFSWSPVSATNQTFYIREYLCFASLPSTDASVLRGMAGLTPSGTGVIVKVSTAGKLQLFNNFTNGQIGSDSTATIVADGTTWYRVELMVKTNNTPAVTDVELRLDGTTVASATGILITAVGTVYFGWSSAPGASKVMYLDDVAVNNIVGTNNSWCGDGKIVLMLPTSDGSMSAGWTAGAGGSSNRWQGVDNTPPVGVANASATDTSQVKCNATAFTATANFFCPTWDTALGTGVTINAVQAHVVSGEDPATGTKAGNLSTGNPTGSTVAFNYGNDQGAQATYLGLWWWSAGAIVDTPTVTTNANFTISVNVTSGTTATRFASVCFLGAYVDYTPVTAAAPVVTEVYGNNFRAASRRAATW